MKWSFLVMMTIAASAGGPAHAGGSLLRIGCEGDDIGAKVQVNGKFKGECPLDIKVKPGTIKLRLHKPLSQGRERVFELGLRIGEDVVKKVDAQLDERYTVAGQQQVDQRVRAEAAESAAKADRARVERSLFEKLSAAASAGDVDAQMRMAERDQTGLGVAKDAERVAYWYRQAAQAMNWQNSSATT